MSNIPLFRPWAVAGQVRAGAGGPAEMARSAGPVPAARRMVGENSGDDLSIRRRPFVV
jgi:hypothetical protein